MKRSFIVLFLCFNLALLYSCGGGGGGGGHDSWTILVYMAADNNLSDAALVDIAEMETVGSENGIKVVVQVDREGEGARRLLIKKDSAAVLDELGEVNMADPATLEDFIDWGIGKYPADRTALILWSHGDGYQKPGVAPSSRPLPFGILQDDTDGVSCCLSNVSVRGAIEATGAHFDLLGFDASRMGQVETANEFSDLADILVFSEETGNENGWEYAGILGGLAANPDMDTASLSELVVKSYGDYYENVYYPAHPAAEQNLTVSAVALGGNMTSLVQSIDAFSGELKSALDDAATRVDTLSGVTNARDAAQGFVSLAICPEYVDLFDFAGRLMDEPNLPAAVLQTATDLNSLKDATVLAEYHGQARPGAEGVSIVFFKEADASCSNFDPAYLDGTSPVAFVSQTGWNEFLSAYYGYLESSP